MALKPLPNTFILLQKLRGRPPAIQKAFATLRENFWSLSILVLLAPFHGHHYESLLFYRIDCKCKSSRQLWRACTGYGRMLCTAVHSALLNFGGFVDVYRQR